MSVLTVLLAYGIVLGLCGLCFLFIDLERFL